MNREQLQARLDAYLAAETRILTSQEYTVDDGNTSRGNKRASLAEVRAEIASIRRELAALDMAEGFGRRVVYMR